MSKKPFVKNMFLRAGIPFVVFGLVCYLIFTYSGSIAAAIFQLISLSFASYLLVRSLKEPYLFNPYLFFAICPLTLAIYFPTISSYYLNEFNSSTYIYALVNMFLFYVGLELCKNFKFSFGISLAPFEKRWPDNIDGLFVAKIAVAFSVVGFIPALYALVVGSFSSWNDLKTLASSLPLYAVIAYFPYFGIYLGIRSKKRRTIIFVLVLGGVATLVSLTKTMVLFFVISFLAAYEKKSERTDTRKLILIGIISLFLFSYLDTFYNQIRGATQYEELWLSRSSSLLSVMQLKTYLYFETPWSNLQYILDTVNEYSYGLWALKPILTLFRVEGLFENVYSILQPYTTFNALGYLVYLYSDFGIVGSCFAIILIGMFVSYVYERGVRSNNPFWGIIVMFVLRAVMMMFFNLHFNTEIYVVVAIILMYIVNLFGRKRQRL